MLTEKDYCDYDTWSALKELGCDIPRRLIPDYFGVLHEPQFEETLHLYDAQKWLREEKRICVEITCCASGYVWELCKAYHKDWFSGGTTIYDNAIDAMLNDCSRYESYEEALLEGIKEAIKILKEDQ